jgi:hypothetical protein
LNKCNEILRRVGLNLESNVFMEGTKWSCGKEFVNVFLVSARITGQLLAGIGNLGGNDETHGEEREPGSADVSSVRKSMEERCGVTGSTFARESRRGYWRFGLALVASSTQITESSPGPAQQEEGKGMSECIYCDEGWPFLKTEPDKHYRPSTMAVYPCKKLLTAKPAPSGASMCSREDCPIHLNLVGTRPPTEEEKAYGKTLEPLAKEVLARVASSQENAPYGFTPKQS